MNNHDKADMETVIPLLLTVFTSSLGVFAVFSFIGIEPNNKYK